MTDIKTANKFDLDKSQMKTLATMKDDLEKARGIAVEVFGTPEPTNETAIGVCARVLCWEEDEEQMGSAGELQTSLEIARDVFGEKAGATEAFWIFDSLFGDE